MDYPSFVFVAAPRAARSIACASVLVHLTRLLIGVMRLPHARGTVNNEWHGVARASTQRLTAGFEENDLRDNDGNLMEWGEVYLPLLALPDAMMNYDPDYPPNSLRRVLSPPRAHRISDQGEREDS